MILQDKIDIKFNKLGVYLMYISLIFIWVSYGGWQYKKTQRVLQSEINIQWDSTISIDYSKRVSNLNISHHYGKRQTPTSEIEINTKEHTVFLNNKSITIPTNAEDKHIRVIQTYLMLKNPIQVYPLDSIFNSLLAKHGISAPTAVSYYDSQPNSKTIYSIADTSFCSQAFATNVIKTAMNDMIVLQGFVQLSWFNYISYNKLFFIFWLGCGMLIIISFIYLYNRKKVITDDISTRDIPIESNPEEPMSITSDISIEENTPVPVKEITNEIIYRFHSRELIKEDVIIQLTPLQNELFAYLLNSERNFQKYEVLIDHLWADDNRDRKRLEQQRRFLQEKLNEIPSIHIRTIPRSGYQLILDEDVVIRREE